MRSSPRACHLALALLSLPALRAVTLDWPAFERALRAYHASPSAVTADAIRETLPSEHVSYDHSGAERSALRALDELLPTVYESIRNGDRVATSLGVDFLVVADGGMLEEIYGALSERITSDPGLFLDALDTRPHVPRNLLTFMGERFVDEPPSVRCNELRDRRRALSGVVDPKLADIRERCLATLDQGIMERCPPAR